MLTNPSPHNKNTNSRTNDPHCASGGDQNLSKANTGHCCINMVHATKVVTHAKDYGSSQPDLGKEPAPPESPFCIENPMDKPKIAPRISRGFLNCSYHNPNAHSVVEDLGQTPCAMFALEVLQSCPSQRKDLLSRICSWC